MNYNRRRKFAPSRLVSSRQRREQTGVVFERLSSLVPMLDHQMAWEPSPHIQEGVSHKANSCGAFFIPNCGCRGLSRHPFGLCIPGLQPVLQETQASSTY